MSRPEFRLPAAYRASDAGQAAWNLDVIRALRELQAVPFLRGRMLSDVAVDVADTVVYHRLGYKPAGFWIVSKPATADVWQPAAPTKDVIHLQASSAVTVDIWVF